MKTSSLDMCIRSNGQGKNQLKISTNLAKNMLKTAAMLPTAYQHALATFEVCVCNTYVTKQHIILFSLLEY